MSKRDERDEGKSRTQGGAGADVGVGGLFKGLGTFVDLLAGMIETGTQEHTRSGSFRIKGLEKDAQGVWGFSVRVGLGGTPQVRPFGNIRPGEAGPEVVESREPLVDVFEEQDQVVLVAELPGAVATDIDVEVHDDVVSLASRGERRYAKEILLPVPVDPASLRRTFNNGLLEIRFTKGA